MPALPPDVSNNAHGAKTISSGSWDVRGPLDSRSSFFTDLLGHGAQSAGQ